jgi:hypothetical protein
MRLFSISAAVVMLFLLGCGAETNVREAASKSPRSSKDAAKKDGSKDVAFGMVAGEEPAQDQPGGGLQKPAEQRPRKIIYIAQVELIVEDLARGEEQLKSLIQEQKAYVAKSDMRGSPGSPRSGSWTIRVPVERFDAFMEAIAQVGELRHSRTDSDDITDRYYDLKAHLKNNEVEEEGLQKLYLEKSATGKLDDLLAVRRELRSIRGDIEQQKGQLQRWDKETEYATVTVDMHDRKDYVPTTAPSFGTSISRTFSGSWESLVSLGKGIVLVIVAVTPWLPVLALVALTAWLGIRRANRRRAYPDTPAQVTPARPSDS